ncbi:hypothetical protein ACFWM1_20210 [Nocardia sp. NPDC058379]|uniref:hypothetical protein n=1 Tax=unclassified Nocardia TaxID=2637762 RepID=UPI00364F689B
MTRHHRPIRVGVLIAFAAAALLGCATTTEPRGPGQDPGPTEAPVIGAEASTQLCEALRADVGNWQSQGTAVARTTFNGAVHNWALRNGAINISVARHREVVDAVTIEQCPDVRDQVIQALDVPDLASGLAGF